MIERAFRIRGYEVDRSKTVPLPVVLSYLEALRWEWIQQPALGLVPHLHTGHFFVVQRQTAEILRRVGMGSKILVRGRFERVGRSQALVHHAVLRAADMALVAEARVTGCWLGPTRRLARIPNAMRAAAALDPEIALIPPGALDQPPLPGQGDRSFIAPAETCYPRAGLTLALPTDRPAEACVTDATVRPSDLDVFEHVNASNWLRLVDDARIQAAQAGLLPKSALAPGRRVSIDHPREAIAGDHLTVYTWALGPNAFAAQVFSRGELCCRALVETAP